ncbi:MAG: lytic murein transglycosylase, partial [Gammaproteobacteria bacterium]
MESFLLLVRDNNIPPLSVKGSHAGALGMSQFISSSYRHYAVDFDEDGKIDLFSSNADAIGSIANYFDKHQWHDGGELSYPIELDQKHFRHVKSSTN